MTHSVNSTGNQKPFLVPSRRLFQEVFSLCLVLFLSLFVSYAERQTAFALRGYPSSVLFLALTLWHKRHFHSGFCWVGGKPKGIRLPIAFATFLILLLTLPIEFPLLQRSSVNPPWSRQLHLLLLVPLAEELYFRGILLEHLKRVFGPVHAVILCSVFFGILHLPFNAAFETLALSILACALTIQSGALVYALQLHVAWNGFVIVGRASGTPVQWFYALVGSIFIGFMALLVLQKSDRHV